MATKLLDGLNEEQRRAVTHSDGPLLIVAGAGTGKTTVITQRIAWLIEQGLCKPEEVLALTFTDKAAGEMEERVDRLLPYGYVNLWISTFHSFCERILKRHAFDIGLPNEFTLLDQTASWLLMKKHFDRFELEYYRPLGNPTKFMHALIKHFSRAKDEAIMPDRYGDYAQLLALNADSACPEGLDEHKRIAELANAYHVYQQLLLENGSMDFGDLILSTVRLFRERPVLLSQYRQVFKYVLVDEFQDTNTAQYELIRLISSPKNNLTVVGDDDQAIFRWRGASYQNILSFERDYPDSTRIILTNNYRSPQNILDSAYAFIQQNNPNRLESRLKEGGGSALSKRLTSADPLPGILEHLYCATLDEEVDAVLKKIIALKEESGVSWGDFAILVRSNDTADPFLVKCAELGIPYHFLAMKGLYAKPIILDIVCFLKVLASCHDSPALYRVLTWPVWDVGHAGLSELTHYAHQKGITLWRACQNVDAITALPAKDREKIQKICGLAERLGAKARQARITELFLTVLKETGLLASISGEKHQQDRENLSFINEFFVKVKSFQQAELNGRLHDFMELLSLEQQAGDEGSLARLSELDPDSVKIMTIHGSKGLEFPYVFLVNMVDRKFPTTERGDAIPLPTALLVDRLSSDSAHMEEERRLMYVALTRAQRGFFCSSAEHYGSTRKRKLSQFLHELGISRETPVLFTSQSFEESRERNETALHRLALPSRFSFSQLTAFRTCPLQYKFSFLLKIPIFGKPAMSFGKTIHETLQKFVERAWESSGRVAPERMDTTPSLGDLLALYQECWIDDWYPSRKLHDEYFAKGKEILTRFHADFSVNKPIVKSVERDFTLKIESSPDVYTLKGRVDRVDTLCDGVEIIDYKTGASKEEDGLAFKDKEQLLLYQIAAEEVFGETVTQLTYYYLEDGKKVSFVGNEKDKQKVRQKAQETLQELRESDFSATPGWHCRFCDFRDICEKRE